MFLFVIPWLSFNFGPVCTKIDSSGLVQHTRRNWPELSVNSGFLHSLPTLLLDKFFLHLGLVSSLYAYFCLFSSASLLFLIVSQLPDSTLGNTHYFILSFLTGPNLFVLCLWHLLFSSDLPANLSNATRAPCRSHIHCLLWDSSITAYNSQKQPTLSLSVLHPHRRVFKNLLWPDFQNFSSCNL